MISLFQARAEASLTPHQLRALVESFHALSTGSDWSQWYRIPVLRDPTLSVVTSREVRRLRSAGLSRHDAERRTAEYFGLASSELARLSRLSVPESTAGRLCACGAVLRAGQSYCGGVCRQRAYRSRSAVHLVACSTDAQVAAQRVVGTERR